MATNEGGPRQRAPARAGAARPQAPLLAFVLHSYDWSESSLIVELFARERGRVVVAAKGAKRPTSSFRPVLLPFQPLLLLLGKAPADDQAEVLNLRSAEWAGGQPIMPAGSLMAGYYLNELLLKLLARQDPHAGLFDAYADTIKALASGVDESTALRAFELLMLRELGLLPDLSTATLSAQTLQAQARYTLLAEPGLVSAAVGLTGQQWVGLEAALSHGGAPVVRHACSGLAAALRGPLRELLDYHLGHTTLRTRQVWQGVQKLTRSARAPAAPST
jgi:DNA repair protein RecO (recombination protein O)